ncbi:hypothetical protein [Longimicrobium terrae]|uniref:Tetratricopeptide (TPR) repeat protein n=1 Tax=Longimicrobium terrae TaxID=1639882 RepID=A0A841H1S1_9BACT|nr:hypothetical protein [Longimicrobium terrae]MBB4637488.1 tetratricopeptide (TPR) repeat protein [Longimicrobium terrae]MBB6071886.1 tetratricopeptide (TPR) repeat protein [Longimicrobium terrae]NNC30434.1 hypothetical protein [Longimicrobium terrae]
MATQIHDEDVRSNVLVMPSRLCLNDLRVLDDLLQAAPGWEPEEADPLVDSFGVELWRAVANVRLWVDTPAERRDELFTRPLSAARRERRAHAEMQAPELVPALTVFAALVDSPRTAKAGELAQACLSVLRWAEDRGMAETAVQFAEAAAALVPASAKLANVAGRTCRFHGRSGRGEIWYERAVGLSRRHFGTTAGRREYISANLGLGAVCLDRNDIPAAIRKIKRAARAAWWAGMKGKAAEAYHDALYFSTMQSAYGRATQYARKAAHLYPVHHRRYPAMVHDVALLMIHLGMYAPALSLLHSVVKRIASPAERLIVWGTVARAAGGAERKSSFRKAEAEVRTMAPTFREKSPAALCSLAEGAALLGNWAVADEYVSESLALAREVGPEQVRDRIERIAADIARRVPGPPALPRSAAAGTVLGRLAPALRLRLARWRGRTWRPVRSSGDPETQEI